MPAAVEAAMLDAYRAELSVIPLGRNKAPTVKTWKPYVDNLPDELDVRRWAATAEGFAILCGGATRLQVLDFEAGFMDKLEELSWALDTAKLGHTFKAWMDGYWVVTPGGGFHDAVHVGGDGAPPGNTKLASDLSGHTLVETRGHGGYVAAAPSNGTTHPSGGQWVQQSGSFEQIAWATADEWQAVCSVISQFDAVAASEAPPEAPRVPVLPGGVSLSRIENTSSWIADTPKPPMSVVLEANGWTYDYSDDLRDYWVRPDKPTRDGKSASVLRENDRLYMHSTDGSPVPASEPLGDQTFDSVDIIGCYRYLHPPSLEERTEIFRTLAGRERPRIPVDIRVPISVCLPDEFWNERPWLAAIRDDALDRLISPEALFGAVLSTYSTTIPPQIKVPRMVGAASPLGMYVALVGGTGTGKSTAMKASRELLGVQSGNDFSYARGLRSGEGLVTLALLPPGKVPKGAEPAPPAFRSGVQISFDEIKALQSQADRLGGTTVSYLISAWSGLSELGGAKAAGVESIPEDTTQFSAVFGVQPGVAAALFTGEALTQGFPGRLLYFNLNSDAVQAQPDERLERPKIGVLGLPRWLRSEGREIGEMEVPSYVETEVRRWRKARMAEANPDPVKAHEMLLRARLSCEMALMDSSAQMLDVHWQWSHLIDEVSSVVRDGLYARARNDVAQRARLAGEMDFVRKSGEQDAWVKDRAVALAKAVHHSPLTARQVKDRFRADKRQYASDVVAYAIEHGWVQYAVGERRKLLIAGEGRPK